MNSPRSANITPFEPVGDLFRWSRLVFPDGTRLDCHSGEVIPLAPEAYSGNPDELISVELRSTAVCNHHCPWCYARERQGDDKLDRDILDRLMESFTNLGVRVVRLLGEGEVLTDPYIPHIIEELIRRNIAVSLITNGGLLTRTLDLHPQAIMGLRYLRVSLDAATGATHGLQHGCKGHEFERILATIERIAMQRDAAQRLPILGATFLVNQASINEVAEAAWLFKRVGFDFVLFRAENTLNDWLENISYSSNVMQQMAEINTMGDGNFTATGIEFLLKRRDHARPLALPAACFAIRNKTTIMPNGDVLLCPNKSIRLGNLYKSSLEEIWTSGRRQRILQVMPGKNCNNCLEKRFNWLCHHTLRNQGHYEKGGPNHNRTVTRQSFQVEYPAGTTPNENLHAPQ